MVEKKKPSYTPTNEISPLSRVFCIFKVLSVEVLPSSKTALHIVKLADSAGTINMVLKSEELIQVCRDAEHVEILNAEAKVHKSFMQLEMDKWGNIRACTDQQLIDKHVNPLNTKDDHSAVEYEIVKPEKDV